MDRDHTKGIRRRARGFLLLLALAPVFGGASPVLGQAGGSRAAPPSFEAAYGDALPLALALELAFRHNPDFRIQEGQLESAERQVRSARGDLLPSLSVSNSYGYQASGERRVGSVVLGNQPDYYSSSYSASLSFSMNGAALLRPQQARAQYEAQEARRFGAASALEAQVTEAYLTVLQADAQVAQAETALERAQLNVRQTRAQVEVGAGTPLDLRRAEVQEGQFEVQLIQTRNQAASSRLALGRLLGLAIPEDVQLTSTFDAPVPDLDAEALIELALQENPVLRASRLAAEAAQTAVRSARSAYLPNFSASAGLSGSVFVAGDLNPLIQTELGAQAGRFQSCVADNRLRALLGDPPRDCAALDPALPDVEAAIRDRVRDNNAGYPFQYRRQPLNLSVSLSLPVFTGGARRRAVEEAELQRSNAWEQVRAEELRLRVEVTTAVRAVETARQIVALQGRIRETAAEELRLAQERFRLGLASSIEVADAQTNVSQAERDAINAFYELQKARVVLTSLLGDALPSA